MLDKLIQDFQLKNFLQSSAMIEWVPYEKFDEVQLKAKGGFSTVYTATWMGGWITDWDEYDRKFLRCGSQPIILKSLDNSSDPDDAFFKE
ncbi:kinase-like protein [Gigaspora margarita]|uniref:Kinase-like protein n=1 Tax=Gigaspora margarita TaxID=4874 RepID=A0A8H4AAK3_GIGMA|nr:kinase-like protein [Gigaspora margarita]